MSEKAKLEGKNVLHLVEHLYLGGIERLLEQLANHAKNHTDERKSNLYFFTYESSTIRGIGESIVEMGLPVYYCKKSKGRDWSLVKKLIDTVKSNNIEVIHTHDFGPIEYALLVKLFVPKVRLIHTQHTIIHFLKNWKYRWFFQLASYFYYAINAVSNHVKTEILKKCPLSRRGNFNVVANGVDTDLFSFSRQMTDQNGKLKMASVSRISPEKNLEYILNTCAILKQKNIDFELHHAGEGDSEEVEKIERFITEHGLENNVFFHGYADDVNPLLDKVDIFLTASFAEGHPVALLEAMAKGKVCFCSDIEAHREISQYAINLFSLNKESELAELLENFHKKSYEYSDQRVMAREQVESHFSLKFMVNNYEGQYNT